MCGILGTLPKTEEHQFKLALDRLEHRGPDGYGIWASDDDLVSLGHRRLAILDLSENGKQPMHYADRYTITFNGEIYNFLEVRKELLLLGYQFQSDSDTEVILAAYHQWQEKCLLKFNGMWAFAIWDKQQKKLFLSRDRFGVKPLFYALIDNKFIFASEMKAIFPFLAKVEVVANFEDFKNDIFGYEQTEKCLIKGIRRFPAGSFATFNMISKELNITKFWDTKEHLQEVPTKYEEQVEQFKEIFIDACKIRMRSDVPIGTALSGGMDSSAIICTMAQIGKAQQQERVNKDWQHAFVATFPNTFLDESVYAKKVVEHININATYLPIDPVSGIDNLEKYLYYCEELYITSPIPMIETYKAIRNNGVVVSIDGHGADELFSGYGHLPYALLDAGHQLGKVKGVLSAMQAMQEFDTKQLTKQKYDWAWYKNYIESNYGRGNKQFIIYLLRSLLGRLPKEQANKGEFGFLNTQLYEIFHHTILPTLLRNYDRYAMTSGVEIRMPFMDYRLVSFCFSLPWDSKLRNGFTKAILRDSMQGIMPDEVRLRRTKIGFNTPIVDWIKGAWKPFLLDTIHSQDFKQSALINPSKVEKQMMDIINNPNAQYVAGEQAWTAIMPYFWEKAVVKNHKKYAISSKA